MVWKKEPFGKTSQGSAATLYTIENKKGMALKVTDLGAAIVEIIVPDRDGVKRDVVLGYEDAKGYEDGTYFFGACVGRNANRTGGASIEINGEIYCLDKNDGENNLHSGWNFYYQRVFRLSKIEDNSITFVLESPHMDQGFPGRVDIYVTYTLSEENEVKIAYHAVPDQDTIINLTNHSYFNLNGHDSKEVLAQKVWIDADAFTRNLKNSVPTGEILDVTGTPMDFRKEKAIGQDIGADYEALIFGRGYDHNWVLNGTGLRKVANMYAEESGIHMNVYTDLPGMQFYTANFVENEPGKSGVIYDMRHGACFETQCFPDATHHKNFASSICKAGTAYDAVTIYEFKIR